MLAVVRRRFLGLSMNLAHSLCYVGDVCFLRMLSAVIAGMLGAGTRPGYYVGELLEEVCVCSAGCSAKCFPTGVNLVDEVIARCDDAISDCRVGQHAAGFVSSKPLRCCGRCFKGVVAMW